jgi:arginine:ornithine antiporter / lysine permease
MSNKTSDKSGDGIKDLSFVALFSLIFGSMMGSGVFDIPQNVAHKASSIAVIISWIITAIGMLSLGWALSYITKKRSDIRSGIYGYAKHGFGDYIGFNSAWGYWLNALLGNASYLIYIFATLGNFALFKFFGAGVNLYSLIAESVLIWLVYFLIACGIKEASLVNIIITSVKILALITIIVLFIYGFNFTKFKSNLTLDLHLGSIFTQIKSTMLVTVWDFLGIEAACIYAVRAKNMKDVVRATSYGIIIVLLIDFLISILPFGILSTAQVSTLETPSTAGVLASISGIWSAEIIRIAILISVVGALLAWTMLATNIIFLAASDRTMPKSLTKINKRNVPSNALLISAITLQIFILGAYFTDSVYLAMIQLATSLILVPYLLAALFAFKLIIKDKKIDVLAFIKGILAVLYGVWLIYAGGLKYLAFSTLLYSVGIIFFALARREDKKPVFDSKLEQFVCIILLVVALVSFYLWLKGYLSL